VLKHASVIGFVPVSDMKAAEDFYAGKLGLTVVDRDNPYALVLDSNGNMIRCALAPDAKPQPFTVLGWQVPDIQAAVRALVADGIQPIRYPFLEQDANGIWTATDGGGFIVWFNDPDGNVLSLSQHTKAAQ
jgi:catechol 2,3-dioxygenase-like lactoylglutathione lyase family enzyme